MQRRINNRDAWPAAETVDFHAWLSRGDDIADLLRVALWQAADWSAEGCARFGHRLAEIPFHHHFDARRVRKMAKVAAAFPADQRDASLCFEAHAAIVRLEPEDRPAMFAQAIAERWNERVAASRVTKFRQDNAAFVDDDPERAVTHLFRLWNNLPADLRAFASPRVQHAIAKGFALIDEEEAI